MSRGVGEIPNEVFQERVRELGLTPGEIARRLGWYTTRPDTQRVRRTLGIAAYTLRGKPHLRKEMTTEMAELFCEALEMDPVDVEL